MNKIVNFNETELKIIIEALMKAMCDTTTRRCVEERDRQARLLDYFERELGAIKKG